MKDRIALICKYCSSECVLFTHSRDSIPKHCPDFEDRYSRFRYATKEEVDVAIENAIVANIDFMRYNQSETMQTKEE